MTKNEADREGVGGVSQEHGAGGVSVVRNVDVDPPEKIGRLKLGDRLKRNRQEVRVFNIPKTHPMNFASKCYPHWSEVPNREQFQL